MITAAGTLSRGDVILFLRSEVYPCLFTHPLDIHIVTSFSLLLTSRSVNMASRNLTKRFVELRNGAKANRNLHMQNDNVSENSDNGLIGVSNELRVSQ